MNSQGEIKIVVKRRKVVVLIFTNTSALLTEPPNCPLFYLLISRTLDKGRTGFLLLQSSAYCLETSIFIDNHLANAHFRDLMDFYLYIHWMQTVWITFIMLNYLHAISSDYVFFEVGLYIFILSYWLPCLLNICTKLVNTPFSNTLGLSEKKRIAGKLVARQGRKPLKIGSLDVTIKFST